MHLDVEVAGLPVVPAVDGVEILRDRPARIVVEGDDVDAGGAEMVGDDRRDPAVLGQLVEDADCALHVERMAGRNGDSHRRLLKARGRHRLRVRVAPSLNGAGR
jgi:hypothetical protein